MSPFCSMRGREWRIVDGARKRKQAKQLAAAPGSLPLPSELVLHQLMVRSNDSSNSLLPAFPGIGLVQASCRQRTLAQAPCCTMALGVQGLLQVTPKPQILKKYNHKRFLIVSSGPNICVCLMLIHVRGCWLCFLQNCMKKAQVQLKGS